MLALVVALQTPPEPRTPLRLQYQLVRTTTIDADNGTPPLVLRMSAFVTISFADSAAGRTATMAIDSSRLDGGAMAAMMPPQFAEDPRDVRLHAYFVNGRTSGITLSSENAQARQLVSPLLLIIAGSRDAKAGDFWADTSSADTAAGAARTSFTTVTTWSAARGEDGAVQLTGTVSGSSALAGQSMKADLKTSGTSHVTTRAGQFPVAATSETGGPGALGISDAVVPLKVRAEVSATLFWPAALRQTIGQIP